MKNRAMKTVLATVISAFMLGTTLSAYAADMKINDFDASRTTVTIIPAEKPETGESVVVGSVKNTSGEDVVVVFYAEKNPITDAIVDNSVPVEEQGTGVFSKKAGVAAQKIAKEKFTKNEYKFMLTFQNSVFKDASTLDLSYWVVTGVSEDMFENEGKSITKESLNKILKTEPKVITLRKGDNVTLGTENLIKMIEEKTESTKSNVTTETSKDDTKSNTDESKEEAVKTAWYQNKLALGGVVGGVGLVLVIVLTVIARKKK